MKKPYFFKISAMLAVLASASIQGYNDCDGPLERGRWYVMPKIGAAPGVFAHRGFIQRVVPFGGSFEGQQAVICQTLGQTSAPSLVIPNQWNVLQQETCRMPKFNQFFHNSVIHVGVEVGRNICDNVQMYFEFTYDRAKAKCYTNTSSTISSPNGCSQDCSTTSSPLLAPVVEIDITLSKYSAYGIFVGTRYYYGMRLFCDRISPWVGLKTGLLHRKALDVCASVASFTGTIPNVGTYTFPAVSGLSAQPFCKSTSAAAGVSLGFDYCFNECLSLLFGFEVVASCPLKSSSNIRIPIQPFPIPTGAAPAIPGTFFPQVTNVIPGNTGTLVQFPVWVGLAWEFDFCKKDCSPCA